MLRVMRASLGEREAIVKAARQRVCSCFDFEAKVEEWETLYLRLLGGSQQPAAESLRDHVVGGF
jgi:hypothetical protein